MAKTNLQRWQLAQQHQRLNQLKKKSGLEKRDQKAFLQSRYAHSIHLLRSLSAYKQITAESTILEVGSGPHGILFTYPHAKRVALDPLARFYRKEFAFIQQNSGALICQGMGEHLPFQSNFFDLIISDNVIDHTSDPPMFLREIYRALKPDGILFLAVNLHHTIYSLFSLAFRVLFFLNMIPDTPNYKTHTYFFTPYLFQNLLRRSRFTVVKKQIAIPSRAHSTFSKLTKPYKNIYSTFVCTKQIP